MAETLRILDASGNERNSVWLQAEFGAVGVQKRAGTGGYYAAVVADSGEPAAASLVVTVRGINGEPLPGIRVAFYWPDAPEDPAAGWLGRCVVGTTDGGGAVGFGMGKGGFYKPAEQKGPHAVWIYGADMSDMVDGLGMVFGTDHRHLDVTFQIPDDTQPPIPPPEPPPECPTIDDALVAVDDLRALLVEIMECPP